MINCITIGKQKGGLANLKEYYAAQKQCMVYWYTAGYQVKWKHMELNLAKIQLQARLGDSSGGGRFYLRNNYENMKL